LAEDAVFTVRVQSQGRLTVPVEVRRLLELKAGDYVRVVVRKT